MPFFLWFPTWSPRGARGTGRFADVGSGSRAQGWYLGPYPLNGFPRTLAKRPSPRKSNPGRVRLPRSTLQPNTQARPKDARPAVPSRLRYRTVIIAIFFHYVIFKLWNLYFNVLHRYRYYFYWATKLQSFPIVYQNHFFNKSDLNLPPRQKKRKTCKRKYLAFYADIENFNRQN